MSMTDSDFSIPGDYKNFRQVTRDRLLYEMLGSAKVMGSKTRWKVLIMDKLTVKIMSCACKMADITEEGVSLVEDICKRRQPMPSMDAIYFIQPTNENVTIFLADMSGRPPLYKRAFVFFSSPISSELTNLIKTDGTLLSCIGALSEINLEYFAIDSQGFTTDHERALEDLFGANAEISQRHIACIHSMAARITTVFASLREFPFVHYRASTSSLDASTITTRCDLIPTKLAAALWYFLTRYKATTPDFPQTETCDLLILDRSVDQIAPIIHEWTYEAMCHDLLNMDGNKYVQEVPNRMGSSPEKKEVLLEDNDPIWLELRHAHIADASEKLHVKLTNFVSRNKAVQIHQNSRDSGELSTGDLQKVVQVLPQYTEQIERLSLHVEIAGKINKVVRESGLRELGQLEQNLIFGDATTKDLINFLRTNLDVALENKLRLLMIYTAINPEKSAGDKGEKLMQLARLAPGDMKAVHNMRYLTLSESKKPSGGLSLKFDARRKKLAARKDRSDEEETWLLSRFYPIIMELLEKLCKGELPENEYQCMNDANRSCHATPNTGPAQISHNQPALSRKPRCVATWAKPRHFDNGCSSDSLLRRPSTDLRKMGRRIFVFIIGGATRSELRVAHKLSSKFRREIILGSTSFDDPAQFITKLKLLSVEDSSLEDLQV